MQFSKIKLTKLASNQLSRLKGQSGLTPNLLCRIGFCLSLNQAVISDPADYPEEEREFNRYTLLGEWDELYIALLREWCEKNLEGDYILKDYFRMHLNRGVDLVAKHAREGVLGILELVQ